MLFQPSNVYPSTFSGIGAGTVDVTQGLNVSWQVNGDTPMTAYQIKIYQNDSGSTLMYDSGSVTVSPAFEPHDKYGNATYFTAIISAAALSTAGIVNGYQYGYKMLITQWWGVSDYVEQTSASVFITRSTPNISIDAIPNPVAASSITITATYSQAQGDPISTVEWVFALAGSESNPIRKTGAISTQVLSFDADGLITGNTYSIMCNAVTSTGMEASTGFVQFPVLYSSSSLGINYQLAQLKNSSAVYLSWDDLGSNILAYPYTDTTKTTNGITFTVNGEGDVVAAGTATADAYFTIAEGTSSQLGMTAGKKFVITSGYSGSKIVITETNGSNVVVSTIEGSDPLQYIATSTTNTLKISIVIPSGSVLSSGQQLKPMIALEDKIVAYNAVSANIEPIQDLNGYSSPWPAGGGANLFDYDKATFASSAYGLTITRSGYIITVAGTSTGTGNLSFNVVSNYADSSLSGMSYVVQALDYHGNKTIGNCYGFRTANEKAVAIQLDNVTAGDSVNVSFKISVAATSQASWTPYENICPISGLTGLSVYRTGKNLLWINRAEGTPSPSSILVSPRVLATDKLFVGLRADNYYYRNYITSYSVTDSTVKVTTTNNTYYGVAFPVACHGNTAYALSATLTRCYMSVGCYDADWNFIQLLVNLSNTPVITFTTPANAAYITIVFGSSTLGTEGTATNIQLELGSTATTYESYRGNTYSVDWTTQAGTVYGGTVDVVTGVLTVDRAYASVASVLSKFEDANGYYWYSTLSTLGTPIISGLNAGLITDRFVKIINVSTGDNDGIIAVYANGIIRWKEKGDLALADYRTYLASNPFQLCYELATPITYQLTPTQVAVLAGTNNVWSTGDSVSVTYTKDTGSQATLSGAIVTFSDSNAVLIPTPQYIPGITGISIYRYLQGELALQHVYDLATGSTSILDYFAPSQTKVSYLLVAHSSVGDLFLQTNDFVPIFWFYSVLLCDTDSDGNYHVSREYIFKYGVETGAVSNNNDPTIQKNFTPYPNRQPISTLYKTGKVSGYIGKTNKLNQYSDTISLQNAIYDISVSPLEKFLKTRKGDVIKVDTASSIQMKTEDNSTQQALKATLDWVEVGDSEGASIVSVSTDQFWPMV